MHLNVQSIVPKIDLLQCEAQAYDVLVFSESWLKPEVDNNSILIENFSPPLRTDRCDRLGGGVIIYVRDSLKYKRRSDLEVRGLEVVWVEIQVKCKKVLIGGFYRPPNSNTDYFNLLSESIDRAINTNIVDIIITGDFNYNMLSNENNKMIDLMNQYSLKLIIKEATHFTENSSSLIDLILVRNNANVLTSGVGDPFIPDQIRYHCPILVLLKFLRPPNKTFKRKIWNYPQADFNKYRNLLSQLDFENHIVTNTNIDDNVKFITESIADAGEQSIPNKIVTIRPNDHPWITSSIRKHIRKRKRIYRKYKCTSNDYYWNKFKKLRNSVVSEIRNSKKAYFDKLEHILNSENVNSKLFWKTSKQVLSIHRCSTKIPTLLSCGEIAESDIQKANMLNDYFSSQTVVNDANKMCPQHTFVQSSTLSSINITTQEVKDILDNLDVTKACGPNHLSPRLLKEGSNILANPLSIIFNRSLEQGYFPSHWKDGNITPIHKKDDKSLPSNYRPISLLDPLGKIMERCVHKHFFNYINENQLLTPFQSGFIPGDSTTYQLLHTYHTFCEAVDSGKEVRAVFCDISKAFDRVWHRGLLYKLSCLGLSSDILKWFSSYLSGRRQRVVLGGSTSEWMPVQAGVPQGSILGPLLFLIYINDIVNEINSSIRLFADDTSLYIIVDN
ncbi:MAG: reverse transcriptase family protein, partial [Candidatus Thiodiazotropha sp.]